MRKICFAFGFSILYMLLFSLGQNMYPSNQFDFQSNSLITPLGLLAVLIMGTLLFLSFYLLEILEKNRRKLHLVNEEKPTPKYYFPLSAGFIFLAWLPCYLAFYPGIVTYDAYQQTTWVYSGYKTWTQQQPVLHTWLWSLCIHAGTALGNDKAAVVIYSLVQMVAMALLLGYCTYWFRSYLKSDVLFYVSLLFFGCFPVNGIMSMIMTKDILFSGLWVLMTFMTIQLLSLQNTDDFPVPWPAYSIVSLLLMLLRNNAIYVLLLLAIYLGIRTYRQACFRNLIKSLVSCFALYFLLTKLLFPVIGIQDVETSEKLSIPLMQMVKIASIHEEELEAEDLELLERYIPIEQAWEVYNPRFADSVKALMYKQDDTIPLMNLWKKWMFQYPVEYLETFLGLHIPYWFIGSKFPDPYADRDYIETGLYSYHNNYERSPILSRLYLSYEEIASFAPMSRRPILALTCGIAFPFTFMLFTLFYCLWKKDRIMIPILIMHLLLLGTYFLGPVSNFRYVFPFFLSYPLYLGAIILPPKNQTSSA